MNESNQLQGTEEWHKARLGKVTASRIADIMAKTKTGPSASRANYMAELIVETMTGTRQDDYMSAAMQWGIDNEPNAKAAYAFAYDADIRYVGFIAHPEIAQAGASPDGMVGDDDGLIEVKCPKTATHIETLLTDTIDKKYIYQMQWQMACTATQWCDFISFDNRMPEHLSLFVKRVYRDDAMIKEITEEVKKFLAEMNEKISKLEVLNNG